MTAIGHPVEVAVNRRELHWFAVAVSLSRVASLIAYHRPAFDLGLIVTPKPEGFPGVRVVGFASFAKVDVLLDQIHSIRLGDELAVSLAPPTRFLRRVSVFERNALAVLDGAKHYPRDPL